jgi:membrane protein DedA with SNARE-associated domain/membrane-associated phospholipid phosphatase
LHYIDTLLVVIHHHPALAYTAVFLVAFLESLALVGLLVPGTVLMFGIGAIVAAGGMGMKPVLVLAAVGAVAGDGLSFWLGRRYRERLGSIWPFRRYPEILKKGEVFFNRHGGKSILFGRFVGPVRPIIPAVAGMLGMAPGLFAAINVLSAIGWAFAYLLPGFFFGTSLALAGTVSSRLAVLIFIVLAASWGFVWLVRRLVAMVARRGPRWFGAVEAWILPDEPAPGKLRTVRRLLYFLFHRPHGEEVFFGVLILLLIGAVWGFLGVLQDVLARDPLVLADQAVFHFLQSLRTLWVDRIFITITEFGDTLVNVCLAVSILAVLLVKRCYHAAGFWAVTVVGGWAGVRLLKWALHLPRPMTLYHGVSAYGFPSGHTTMSVILFGFIAILLMRGVGATWRWGNFVAALLISFIIAVSRLYLGAHWLSDVLGGLFIGTAWTALLGIAYLKSPAERVPRALVGLTALLVIAIVGGGHAVRNHDKDLSFYAPQRELQSMRLGAWLADGWRRLPLWRVDMVGEREQPLTIQWAGSAEKLKSYLITHGWEQPPPPSLKNFLGMLSPEAPIDTLPVLPRLHNGRVDAVRLVRWNADRRWVLRLWPSDVAVDGYPAPLLIGTIELQRRRHLTWLITAALDTGEYSHPREALVGVPGERYAVETVHRAAAEIDANHRHEHFDWQGQVLLVRSLTPEVGGATRQRQ